MTSVELCESLGLAFLCWCNPTDPNDPSVIAVWDGANWVDEADVPITSDEIECPSCGKEYSLPEPVEKK